MLSMGDAEISLQQHFVAMALPVSPESGFTCLLRINSFPHWVLMASVTDLGMSTLGG